ncbi:MAG: glycoside hydrolase family 2, partial [Bacteroidetes bacterium]|nr:glycoside hydrolase family 2 [Bacteroidota bacterium]
MLHRIYTSILLLAALSLRAQTTQIQYLSGTGSDHTVAWDFFCTGGHNSGVWTKIPVPSCWELQGFGAYNYGRDYKTYGKNFRFADEKGMYRYSFRIPAAWKGKKISIVFEGSMTDTEVKINGRSAGGIHQGAFYEFKYDITDKLLSDKPNLLEVTVSKMSADPSVNNAERLADYWVFGGIFRPVYLEALPAAYIGSTAVNAKADGSFALQASVKGLQAGATLQATITDSHGKMVATINTAVNKNDSLILLNTKVDKPLQWT